MNIIIMGPPGAGKGTACKLLPKEFGLNLITAGDLLREEKTSGSELGNYIASLIDAGNLVPDEVITNILKNEVKRVGTNNLLIDGYPRTLEQGKALKEMINNNSIIIWLTVSDETTIKRNLKRGLTSGRPDDSNEEVIKLRIENYYKDSFPLKEYYKDYGNTKAFIEVDAEGSPDEVYLNIVKLIKSQF